jgi:hypothetical protein
VSCLQNLGKSTSLTKMPPEAVLFPPSTKLDGFGAEG